MNRLGEVVRTAQGLAILRAPPESTTRPDIGDKVLNQDLDEIGEIVDIFGPTDRPYIAVSPAAAITPPTLLSEKLYTR